MKKSEKDIQTKMSKKAKLIILAFALHTFILGVLLLVPKIFIIYFVINLIILIISSIYLITSTLKNEYKISYLILFALMPIMGLLIYKKFTTFKFKGNKIANVKQLKFLSKKNLAIDELRYDSLTAYNQAKYMQDYCLSQVCKHTKTTYLSNTNNYYKKLIEQIKQAQKFIFIEVPVLEELLDVQNILNLLKEKIASKTEVRIIFSKSKAKESKALNALKSEGFKIIKGSDRDLRNMIIIDGYYGFVTGLTKEKSKGHGILLEGEATWSLTVMFLTMYDYISKKNTDFKKYKLSDDDIYATSSDGYVIPYFNTPEDEENLSENVYLNLINKASKFIYITTPYLFLSTTIIKSLSLAAKKGIDVKIIVGTKNKLTNSITKSYCQKLINNKIRIYEHTKRNIDSTSIVVDGNYAIIGTTSLDYRNYDNCFECGVWLYNCHMIHNMTKDFTDTLRESAEIIKIRKEEKKKIFKTKIIKMFYPIV